MQQSFCLYIFFAIIERMLQCYRLLNRILTKSNNVNVANYLPLISRTLSLFNVNTKIKSNSDELLTRKVLFKFKIVYLRKKNRKVSENSQCKLCEFIRRLIFV